MHTHTETTRDRKTLSHVFFCLDFNGVANGYRLFWCTTNRRRRQRGRLHALNTKVEPDAQVIQPRSRNSRSWKNKQSSVILIACSQLWALLCVCLLFWSLHRGYVFIRFFHRRPGLCTNPCVCVLRKEFGGRGGRLTLSRHETVLLSCVQPHETPRVGADAHGQSALLNKSTTGGDAETHKRLKQERGKGASRLVCLQFAGKRKRLPEPLNLWSALSFRLLKMVPE